MKFKVGDRVKINTDFADAASVNKGDTGLIVLKKSYESYLIKMDDHIKDKGWTCEIGGYEINVWDISEKYLDKIEEFIIKSEEDYYTWLANRNK